MIPKKCKRLAEVDFPIAEVSRHAAREQSIWHRHPFLRLANALAALYPTWGEEKRLLDAMLLVMPR